MPKWDDFQYIVDGKGRRKAVIISYRKYLDLLEDIADLTCIEERKDDPRRDLESILAELRSGTEL